ncbi:MAG: PEP-CTERM sorting domain-containing protein [Planctomycetes bacterium]|nr:PEP-CTERM sorting domain-containing protein [Planctomycetota bacterium]
MSAQAVLLLKPIAVTNVTQDANPALGPAGVAGANRFVSLEAPVINNAGQVAYRGFVGIGAGLTHEGIWRYNADGTTQIVYNTTVASANLDDAVSGSEPLFDDLGNIAFFGFNKQPDSQMRTGIFRTQNGSTTVMPLVHTGTDGALGPDLGAGISINTLRKPTGFRNGKLVFDADLTGSGINFNNDTTFFRSDDASSTLVLTREAAVGSSFPGPDIASRFFANSNFGGGVNAAGNAISGASLNDNSFGTGVYFIADGSTNHIIAMKNATGALGPNIAGNPGAVFTFIQGAGTPDINDAGDAVFTGRMGTSRPNVIVRHTNGVNAAVVLLTDMAPGTTGSYKDFAPTNSPVIAGNGDIFFAATVTNPTNVNQFFAGLWRQRDGEGVSLVALDGSSIGLGSDVHFTDLHSVSANARGDVAFRVQFIGAGVTAANDNAVLAFVDGVLEIVAREGDQVDVDPTDGVDLRTIDSFLLDTQLHNTGGQDGRRSYFNDLDQVVLGVTFTDGSTGVLLTNLRAVPEPASLLMLLAVGSMLRHRRR